jgi:integrase
VQVRSVAVVNAPETDSGERVVSLGADAVGVLLGWQLQQDGERVAAGDAWQSSGYLFAYADGRPLLPQYVSKAFERITADAGMPHLTLHGLRHEHASLMLEAGVPLLAVSKRLGHKDVRTTANIYSHLFPQADRDAATAVEGLIRAAARTRHARDAA